MRGIYIDIDRSFACFFSRLERRFDSGGTFVTAFVGRALTCVFVRVRLGFKRILMIFLY